MASIHGMTAPRTSFDFTGAAALPQAVHDCLG